MGFVILSPGAMLLKVIEAVTLSSGPSLSSVSLTSKVPALNVFAVLWAWSLKTALWRR